MRADYYIRIEEDFLINLEEKIAFISQDKPDSSQEFLKNIFDEIESIAFMPYKHRKSIYFDDVTIRDLIYKGYTIGYKIEESL